MVPLRKRIESGYADWREDLPPGSGWPVFFDGCPEPGFAANPDDPEIEDGTLVWPGREGANLRGAPAGAHICRAFEGIDPEDVRVVVLGQDPYPSIAKATGRAFEDGAWQVGGSPQKLAGSLKPLMLAAWASQNGHAELFRRGGWSALIHKQNFLLPDPRTHFDTLAE